MAESGEQAYVDAQRASRRLDADEVASLSTRALAIDHWRTLCPGLTVESEHLLSAIETDPFDDAQRARLVKGLATRGYLKSEPFLSDSVITAMRHGIETLATSGWPPVFAYVYDDFWRVLRSPSLVKLMTEALGEGYRQSPRVWAFSIAAAEGAAGWPPHVDGGAGTHTADRVTVWIPLSDATLENGCMYLVPKDRAPSGIADEFANAMTSIDARAWRTMLQASRAMPARAGSILAWDFQVIHWSGFAGDAEEPRVSLAVELLGPNVALSPSEEPTLDARALPPFRARLAAIARGILSYQRFEPAMLRYEGLARALLDTIDADEPQDVAVA